MTTLHSSHRNEIEEGSIDIVHGKFQFYGGLKKCIGNLNGFLIQLKMPVVGLKGMGGRGKTTRGTGPLQPISHHRIPRQQFDLHHRFTVLKPTENFRDCMGEDFWNEEARILEFGGLAHAAADFDATKKTLVILDDVWSRANLEYLLFEGPGHQPFITSRGSSTIFRIVSNQQYPLPIFWREDAVSLFCFWAFGQA